MFIKVDATAVGLFSILAPKLSTEPKLCICALFALHYFVSLIFMYMGQIALEEYYAKICLIFSKF